MSHQRLMRRRQKLWLKNCRCVFCGTKTILPPPGKPRGRVPDNWATIEHLDSRYNPERGNGTGERTVLCCWRCNNDRNKAEQQRVPIDELQRRAAH